MLAPSPAARNPASRVQGSALQDLAAPPPPPAQMFLLPPFQQNGCPLLSVLPLMTHSWISLTCEPVLQLGSFLGSAGCRLWRRWACWAGRTQQAQGSPNRANMSVYFAKSDLDWALTKWSKLPSPIMEQTTSCDSWNHALRRTHHFRGISGQKKKHPLNVIIRKH